MSNSKSKRRYNNDPSPVRKIVMSIVAGAAAIALFVYFLRHQISAHILKIMMDLPFIFMTEALGSAACSKA